MNLQEYNNWLINDIIKYHNKDNLLIESLAGLIEQLNSYSQLFFLPLTDTRNIEVIKLSNILFYLFTSLYAINKNILDRDLNIDKSIIINSRYLSELLSKYINRYFGFTKLSDKELIIYLSYVKYYLEEECKFNNINLHELIETNYNSLNFSSFING